MKDFRVLLGICVLLVFLMRWAYDVYGENELEKENNYTAGLTIEFRDIRGRAITFKYCVDNKLYFSYINFKEGVEIKYPNQCYKVRYWSKDPSICKLMIDQPIEDCTINCKP